MFGAAVARVAGQGAPSPEAALINGVHHQNHGARSLFPRYVLGKFIPVFHALLNVAIDTIQPQRCGKEAHCVHEFADGNSLEHLDIFENLLRHQRVFRSGLLAARYRGAHEIRDRNSRHLPRYGLHAAMILHSEVAVFGP